MKAGMGLLAMLFLLCIPRLPSDLSRGAALAAAFDGLTMQHGVFEEQRESGANSNSLKVKAPLLGEIDVRDYSLPTLAILLGLIDGFNPCAMWALVYLISLVVSLNDRKKIWLIVGTFVLTSGVLYFLFMSAWLNAFLLMGYTRPITLAVGLVSIYVGISGLVELIRVRGALECKIAGEASKKNAYGRMKKAVLSPGTLTSILSIIGIAFLVNSMEFLCSCAIPAVFTHVLSMSSLSRLEHYGYILLYDFFFMLDDLIVFGSAVFLVSASIGNRYVAVCRIAGGILLLVLGILLIFRPHMLMM